MQDCNSCGKCCIKYSNGALYAEAEEIAFWENVRPYIADKVNHLAAKSQSNIWFNNQTQQPYQICPWLSVDEKRSTSDKKYYLCDIYYDRPNDCRLYPTTISEMINDQCEMIEVKDLTDLNKAQKEVDKLMADNRPAG